MSASYQIVMWELMEITEDQARALLDSGLYFYKNERNYLASKAGGVPFNKIKFPRYMTNEMAVIRAKVTKAKTKDWEKWQVGGE